MKHSKKLSCLLLLAVLLLFPPNGTSCGPFFPDAVFTYEKQPGPPLTWFAEGHLGVVLPGFTRSYLVIAYRYLAGRPLSKSERDGAMSYWRWGYSNPWVEDGGKASDPVQEWLAARKQALGAGPQVPEISNFRWDEDGFSGSENCLADSFHNASVTLSDRARRFGGDRAAIQEWIKGQDLVFSDCDRNKTIPPALSEPSPAWLKADRHYQVAAAYFYSRSFDQAAQQFDEIASDSASPWRGIAPYLAARAMIRKGAFAATVTGDALPNAESRLQKILNDPAQPGMRKAARQMLAYIEFRLHPQQRNAELARLLSGPRADPDFYQDLIDYTRSMDHVVEAAPEYFTGADQGTPLYNAKLKEWQQQQYRGLAQLRATAEMTDWLLTFQEPGPANRIHAVERWRKTRGLPWLVAALSKIDATDGAAGDLLHAAEQVTSNSPAYPMVSYDRVRLLIQAGEGNKARMLLDEFLASPPSQMTASSLNLFLAQRFKLATSFHDFLVRAPRPMVDVEFNDGFWPSCKDKTCNGLLYGLAAKEKTELRFDRDAVLILNLRLPLDLIARAATGEELPEPLRGEMAVAVWTRAVMLDRHDLAAQLVPEMEKTYPVMKEQLENYRVAKPEEKTHAALFVILHFPGMRPYVNSGVARTTQIDKIDNYRDNWWCADVGAAADEVNYAKDTSQWHKEQKYGMPKDAPGAPAFLSAEQSKAAAAEWAALSTLDAGSSYLTRQTLAWAKERPHDANVPEALHLAVRSTRYGCADAKVSILSRKAFTLLHERYPNSKWAKQTPYWF